MNIKARKPISRGTDSTPSEADAGMRQSDSGDPSDDVTEAAAPPEAAASDPPVYFKADVQAELPTHPVDDLPRLGDEAGFPIVGIGASAGGLNPIRRLLSALSPDAGLAYVVVQHLDPAHPSLLAALLSGATAMPVSEAGDGMRIERDHLYVIPPNCRLGVHHGRLLVLERSGTRGLHLPVDYFLGTLADDIGPQAVGVVLSGTGADGTQGLKAIKAAGGMTFAQDEQSAEYFGMPGSAAIAGSVDLVLPPEQIASSLMRIARHPYLLHASRESAEKLPANEEDLGKIFLLLRSRTGNDFTFYKRETILRRIKRRMAVHMLDRLPDYVHYLQSKPAEIDALFGDLLISVTGFFREPESFDVLRERVYPILFDAKQGPEERAVRVWVPACATGEEAYSLAMSMVEYLGAETPKPAIQIFGTDVDEKAIARARLGVYSNAIVETVSAERLKRFFIKTSDGYQVAKEIRAFCVFAVQNVLKDPPFSRLDLVSCRNLMIYLGPLLQRQMLETFHYALDGHRFLMLGISESIGARADLFLLFDRQGKIYEKKSNASRRNATLMPPLFNKRGGVPRGATQPTLTMPMELGEVADRMILLHYGPPGVVVSNDLEVLFFRGETGPYLNPSPGSATLNLLRLTRRELAVELRSAIDEVRATGAEVVKERVWYRHDGVNNWVGLRVLPINEANQPTRLMVLFEEAGAGTQPVAVFVAPSADQVGARADAQADSQSGTTPVPVDERLAGLERQLAVTRDYLQSIITDQEHSNEQLKAANEEVQSANEELRSAVEELETAKEELQSTNEELATVNNELETRNHELAESNSDLATIIASINLPFLMLGEDLRIRQFTPQAAVLLNLIPGDIGRPILNIKPNLEIPDLARRVQAVIEQVSTQGIDLQDVDGHWYSVRISPYQSAERRIEGVVIAFVDIDAVKSVEARLRDALEHAQRLEALVRDAEDAILVLGFGGAILAWNPAAERIYGYSEETALAMPVERMIPPGSMNLHLSMIEGLRRGEHLKPIETERVSADGRHLAVLLHTTALLDAAGVAYAMATTERLLSAR